MDITYEMLTGLIPPLADAPYWLVILIVTAMTGLISFTFAGIGPIVYVYGERKIAGFMQDRLGPMRVGKWGLLQTIADESERIDTQIEAKLLRLEGCLAQLQDRTRAIVSDYYYENLSIKEIADGRSLKTNHIAQVLFRARKALFQCMTDPETDTHE